MSTTLLCHRHCSDPRGEWNVACNRLLEHIRPAQRSLAEGLLHGLHNGGAGLRMWITAIVSQGAPIPEEVPIEVIDVYLKDPEALPLYACQSCQLRVPVRPSRRGMLDDEPEYVYWSRCPCCNAITGWPHNQNNKKRSLVN